MSDKPFWHVQIIDHSGASPDEVVEEVGNFADLNSANAFARAYVRDSIERARVLGGGSEEVIKNWATFGEDARVVDANDAGWKSSCEVEDFASSVASPDERDWRKLDPRRKNFPA